MHAFILGVSGLTIQLLCLAFQALGDFRPGLAGDLPWIHSHASEFGTISAFFMVASMSLGAIAKGRSGLWGLLGFLSCIGILGYLCLNAVCPYCARKPYCHREACGNCGAPL